MGSIQFTQIHPRAFAHPSDRRATSAFEQLPVFPELLRKISQLGIEERFCAHHMYNSVKIGRNQLPTLWNMVHEVAERLCIPAPVTYVTRLGEANAFAFGMHTPSIVLTSKLVDMMSDVELRGIIAHEMGHILCRHMLYMNVGLTLSVKSGAVSTLAKVLPGLEESVAGLFFAWFRAAEYSADRAALLILEDPEPLTRCLSRLAGVPDRFKSEFDLGLFAGQAKDYEEEATLWSKIVNFGNGLFLTHPEPAKRLGAILEWAESEEYRGILRGCYLTKFEADALDQVQIAGIQSCPLCRRPVGQAPVCGYCGLPQDPRRQQYCPCRHVASVDWKFCKSCGVALKACGGCNGTPGS
jgi:Zn-dependent protease with chaperone function